jgi:uncharacterized protein
MSSGVPFDLAHGNATTNENPERDFLNRASNWKFDLHRRCMSQIELLYRLQQIDDELRQKKNRLTEVIRAQRGNAELEAARQRAARATAVYQKHHTRHTDLNLELKGVTDKARRSEERLYSGLVKNPKELADLQQEIEALTRRCSALEDEILETMIALEEAEVEKAAAEETLAGLEEEWEQTRASLQQEQATLAQRSSQLADLRQQQVRRLTPATLVEYEAISRHRGGVAVVGLSGNICQGCRLTVPANMVKAAGEGQLVKCPSCGRLVKPL